MVFLDSCSVILKILYDKIITDFSKIIKSGQFMEELPIF